MNAITAPPDRSALSYYYFSIFFALAAVAAGWAIGGPATALIVAVLTVLEVSLSLDNAVVNAKILENWDERWRKIFLFWGILIAVFGMRLVFPIVIVCFATGLGPVAVTQMALFDQAQYAQNLTAAHHQVAGFGGAFLLMVALGFFFQERHVYWLEWAETKLTKLGQIEAVSAAVTLGAIFLAKSWVLPEKQVEFFTAGVLGVVLFIVVHGLGSLVGPEEAEEDEQSATSGAAGKIVRQGAMGFLYIEILDASFSFDGVIGAFALTNYLPVIMLGLGAGAFFVRAATVHLVEKKALAEFPYVEHGAFLAILVLACIMLAPEAHIPEWFTGLSGAAVLAFAFWRSVVKNKRDSLDEMVQAMKDGGFPADPFKRRAMRGDSAGQA